MPGPLGAILAARAKRAAKMREVEEAQEHERLLAALRSLPQGVHIAHVEGADINDLYEADGFAVDIEPDGHFEVWHCYGDEPHTWHGEGQLTAAGIDEDTADVPLSSFAFRALEKRIWSGLSEAFQAGASGAGGEVPYRDDVPEPLTHRPKADACPTCGSTMQETKGDLSLPIQGVEVVVPDSPHLRCPACAEVVLRFEEARMLRERAIDRRLAELRPAPEATTKDESGGTP